MFLTAASADTVWNVVREYSARLGKPGFAAQGAARATAAAVALSVANGAHIVRVHDVAEMRVVAHVADEVVKASAIQVQEPQTKPAVRPRGSGLFEQERPKPTRPTAAAAVASADSSTTQYAPTR